MGRAIGAVIAGYALWSVLWVGANGVLAQLMPDVIVPGTRIESVPLLLGYIVWSGVLSVLAGFVTARIARERSRGAVGALAAALLLTGIGVEVSSWSIAPAWYHITFLVLLVPLTLFGGRLAGD